MKSVVIDGTLRHFTPYNNNITIVLLIIIEADDGHCAFIYLFN